MSNCCMRRPAKFHDDSAVRFLAIVNIREGGGASNAPPPVKRGLNEANTLGYRFLFARVQFVDFEISVGDFLWMERGQDHRFWGLAWKVHVQGPVSVFLPAEPADVSHP